MARAIHSGIVIVLLMTVAAIAARASAPPDIVWERDIITLAPGQHFESSIVLRVASGRALEGHSLDVEFVSLEGVHIDSIELPRTNTTIRADGNLTAKAHEGDVLIRVAGHVPSSAGEGERELVARVSFRECSPSWCYPAGQRDIPLIVRVGGVSSSDGRSEASEEVYDAADMRRTSGLISRLHALLLDHLADRGLFGEIGVVFLAGLVGSLTICLWPVIPVILLAAGGVQRRGLLHSAVAASTAVIGFVPVYAALSVAAVMKGNPLGFAFQQPWVLAFAATLFVTVALMLFCAGDRCRRMRWVERLRSFRGSRFVGAVLAGVTMGIIVSPCAGPVIDALLARGAREASYAHIFVLFVIYGMGMGLIIACAGTFCGVLVGRLRGRAWFFWTKRGLGMIMLVSAAFYVSALFAIDGIGKDTSAYRISWIDRVDDGLMFAAREGRPLMVDVYADWCTSCRRLDRTVLRRPKLVELSYRMVPVRLDVTRDSTAARAMFERFRIVSLPTILFLAPDGGEYDDLRLVSPTASALEASMRSAVDRAGSSGAVSVPDGWSSP